MKAGLGLLTVAAGLVAGTAAGFSAGHEIRGSAVRPDGSDIAWTLSNALRDHANPVVLVAHGSGCAPARSSASVDLMTALFEESGYAVLTVEKYGVSRQDTPDDAIDGCSPRHVQTHTVSRRVADVEIVLDTLRAQRLFDDDLILFGGSEGGAVVSVLSRRVQDADAVVVLSTGTGLTLAEFFPMVVPPSVAARMQAKFEEIRRDRRAKGILGGVSYQWWRDSLDRRLSDDLLASDSPVLLVHGENDRSAPVETARATRDAFWAAGDAGRLTYWELPDRDHAMVDPHGVSHMRNVLERVRRWMSDRMPAVRAPLDR